MRIIARSRIGYWTAFAEGDTAYLNIRDEDGRPVTVVLTPEDEAVLAGPADTCHPHARDLAAKGPRLAEMLPTPPRGLNEPEAHEWEPRETRTLDRVQLKAA